VIHEDVADIAPGAPYLRDLPAPRLDPTACELAVEHGGDRLVTWRPRPVPAAPTAVEPATEPPAPTDIASNDELYLTGLHLDQYRHATRAPEPYWAEALRRDPGDARCNTALAARLARAGRLQDAERHLRAAVARLTRRNPNPRDGEAHYRLGLVLARLGRHPEAKETFGKALWDHAWADAAAVATARLDLAAGRDAEPALRDLVRRSPLHTQARNLLAVAAMRRGDRAGAAAIAAETLRDNPLDAWARDLAHRLGRDAEPTTDPAIALDVALEYRSIRDDEAAIDLLATAARLTPAPGQVNIAPIAWLHRADLEFQRGDETAADTALQRVRDLDRTWCFPSHTEDDALARLRARRPDDPVLAALAGHRLYAAGRHGEAVESWETAAASGDPVVLRNLGVAAHNVQGDPERAAHWYRRAREAAPDDARLLYETDQLDARRGVDPAERLAALEHRRDLVAQRDDLSVQLAELLTAAERADDALDVLTGRAFQPWEGGEGRVLAAWEHACLALARAATDPRDAVRHVEAALAPPANLGEARHPLANTADLHLALGDACAAAGDPDTARRAWTLAAAQQGDFQTMQVQPHSEHTAAAVTALRRLGEHATARALRDDLARYIDEQARSEARIDYFATSLPTMLLFTADLQAAHDTRVLVLRAQLALLDDEPDRAADLARTALERDPLNPAARTALASDLTSGAGRP
jgi:tetratricopeptide (TPR) repeat protein